MSRTLSMLIVAMAFLASTGAAAEKSLSGTFSYRAGPNFYHVQFPAELGGVEIDMTISGGQFDLAYDAEAGTSHLVSWNQEIDPIVIYGANTGPITVGRHPTQPSTGTFAAETSTFDVTASFILSFDDTQLQALGFSSPFVLTSTEHGSIYGVGQLATVGMLVSGKGTFGGGEFAYTCQSTAEVNYDIPEGMGQPGDINLDHRLDLSDCVAALADLFLGQTAVCPAAIEGNGDGQRDISDAVFLLAYLFQGGIAPPAIAIRCDS